MSTLSGMLRKSHPPLRPRSPWRGWRRWRSWRTCYQPHRPRLPKGQELLIPTLPVAPFDERADASAKIAAGAVLLEPRSLALNEKVNVREGAGFLRGGHGPLVFGWMLANPLGYPSESKSLEAFEPAFQIEV